MIDGKRIIALCTTRINDIDIHSFIRTLYEETFFHDFRIMVFALNADLYWNEEEYHSEASVFEAIPYDIVDILVIMDERIKSHTVAERIIAKASKSDIPVIVIDGEYEGTISIKYDYALGFEKIVRHVIEDHKIRHPHIMAGDPGNKFSEERIGVFKKVCEENDIPFDESMVSYGEFWSVPARAATKKILRGEKLPEAIICCNDIMAINVCDVLSRWGISVPDKILVTGFDGISETNFTMPRISTVKCDSTTMAKTVAKICINNELADCDRQYSVIPELDIKESCGCVYNEKTSRTSVAKMNDSCYRYTHDIRLMHGFTTKLQLCRSFDDVANELFESVIDDSFLLHHIICVLYDYCLDKKHNLFLDEGSMPNTREKVVICDFLAEAGRVEELPAAEVLPHLHELLEEGHPLIFNALDTMDKPLGYICYKFDSFNIIDYSKTASISNHISMALNGFINMQHQHYLADKVDEMYRYDALTGLYNRSGFQLAFDKLKSEKADENLPVTVIMADLDDLKVINDGYGHDAGDKAIATVARALSDSCPAGSLCMRYGGDEMFALIVGECDADGIILHINDLLKVFNDISGFKYKVNVSCGHYSAYLTEYLGFDDMVKGADERMYAIKKEKKSKKVSQ